MALAGNHGNNVLNDEGMANLKAEMFHLQRTVSNLKNRLATFGVRRHESVYIPPLRVRFRNDSSESVPAYGVMRLTGTASIAGKIVPTIDKPDTSFNRLYLVNGSRAVASGKPGWGTWLWHADWVLYDDAATPAFGEEWGPSNGSWKVSQNRPGFYIWGGATGGSTDRVKASQKFAENVLGKADAAIANGASGTVRVYIGTPGSETDSGQAISSAFNKGPDIADEAWVTVSWPHGKPYVWLADCP